jgi:hypothetical protein
MYVISNVLEKIWAELDNGVHNSKHAFHTPTLGTLGERGCRTRTVVLRTIDQEERTLSCHIDIRSDKATEIRLHPRVSWLFYAPELKLQIRAEGEARIHHMDDIARNAWANSLLSSRRCYLADPGPGVAIEVASSGLPEWLTGRAPTEEESEKGWLNFAVMRCEVDTLDWYYLDSHGNTRAIFNWDGTQFKGHFAIP